MSDVSQVMGIGNEHAHDNANNLSMHIAYTQIVWPLYLLCNLNVLCVSVWEDNSLSFSEWIIFRTNVQTKQHLSYCTSIHQSLLPRRIPRISVESNLSVHRGFI